MMGVMETRVESETVASSAVLTSSQRIVRIDIIGTVAFVVSATTAAIVFTGPARVVGVIVALALFAIGVFAFLWSYITAVNRSRTDNIAVAQLYFLASGSTPKLVKRVMMSALAVQVVVALATALARSSTDGRAGSTLAFGILVPMFGLGLNGLWCSKYGSFSPRQAPPAAAPGESIEHGAGRTNENLEGVPPSDDEMEQNSPHG